MTLPHDPAPLCFIDTETDGVHPDRKVWEIAIIHREPDGRQTEWQAFVEIDLSTANSYGLQVGRFYDRHPVGRQLSGKDPLGSWISSPQLMPRRDAAHRVAQLTHGAHVLGAVPNFDTEVLDRLLRKQGLIPAWHYHLLCVEAIAVGYLSAKGIKVTPPYRSNDLSEALGVEKTPDDERHTALGDARWAMRMYDAMMASTAPTGEVSWT